MFLSPTLPRRAPAPAPDHELETIEWFVACDPLELEEESVEPECLSLVAGAVLGGLGLEALHHAIEGLEHFGELQDSLRPVIQRQQLADAITAFKRAPRPFSPGEVKGVYVRVQVPRRRLQQAVLETAPSRRMQPTPAPAPAVARRSPPPRHRPLMKLTPSWVHC